MQVRVCNQGDEEEEEYVDADCDFDDLEDKIFEADLPREKNKQTCRFAPFLVLHFFNKKR